MNQKNDWLETRWRPGMGWTYMAVCVFDFIIFPIGWAIFQGMFSDVVTVTFTQWNPITLQASGLFHMAMGAVLGVTSWGRSQEKLKGVSKE